MPTPPARKKTVRQVHVLSGLHDPIDVMLRADRTIEVRDVWERLIDDHDATVSYATVRDYVARHRSDPLGQPSELGQH